MLSQRRGLAAPSSAVPPKEEGRSNPGAALLPENNIPYGRWTVKTTLTVSVDLDADDQEAARFEEKLKSWLRSQNQVVEVTTARSGMVNDIAWKSARKAAFGSRLPHPFGHTDLTG